jgi:hypothetical protein
MMISIGLFIPNTFSVNKYARISVYNSGNHIVYYFAQNMLYKETLYNKCVRLLTYLIKYFGLHTRVTVLRLYGYFISFLVFYDSNANITVTRLSFERNLYNTLNNIIIRITFALGVHAN